MARDRELQKNYNRAYYQENRGRIRLQQAAYGVANRSQIAAVRKGLTAAAVQALLDGQGGLCAICTTELATPHVDHDHSCCPGSRSCGKCVRGLLCASCNHMLGKAYDKPEVLEAGARYLRRFSEGGR
jgi:hypothetical protein